MLLTGGGSGGSATPVIAVGQAIRALRPDAAFLYVGTNAGPEGELVRGAGFPFVGIPAGRLRRYFTLQNLGMPFLVIAGLVRAGRLVRRFRPGVAFGAGGFGTLTPLVMARLHGVPVAIHQQDVVPGLANRLLAPLASLITVALEGTEPLSGKPAVVVGNPVRGGFAEGDGLAARRRFGLDEALPVVLVVGGGTGALRLNQIVAEAAPGLCGICSIVHLTGAGKTGRRAPLDRYVSLEFVADGMADLLAAADVVVSRAGMAALTEIAVTRKAAILVPMPASHQEANAAAMERQNAARVLHEGELTAEGLTAEVRALLGDAARRQVMGDAAARVLPRDAASAIAYRLIALAEGLPPADPGRAG